MAQQIKIIVVFLSLFLFASQNLSAAEADTEFIPSDKYFETTLNEINQAKSSIQVYMYLISVLPDQPDSQPNRLVDALVKATERGVNVKVVLDQTINFQEPTDDNEIFQNKNQEAYVFLKQHNVPVYFDEAQNLTHAKAVIIDNETLIIGSTNWSKSALTRNHEANLLVRSKSLASDLLKELTQIPLQQNIPSLITPSVPVPKDFFTDKKLLGEMVAQSDERTFDSYLYLLSQHSGDPESKIILDYDNLAKSLKIDHMTKEDYRRQINKVLSKLESKYKLVDFKLPERNQNTEVVLKDLNDPKKLFVLSEINTLPIPQTFWKYHWNQTLSFPAKVMYLINLFYSNNSSQSFFMSREQLSDIHHISESFISDGTKDLNKLNLLDIKYDSPEGKPFKTRLSNTYTPKPLYDPEELKKELKVLEEKYGKEKLTRAVQIASIVSEENNPKTIEALIDLEDKYGTKIIKEASDKIAIKSPDNPKKTAGYLINTIKAMAKETQQITRENK